MKFKYIGKCARGEVVFTTPDGTVVMPYGEVVDVPSVLVKKLAANPHFEAVENADEQTDSSSEDGISEDSTAGDRLGGREDAEPTAEASDSSAPRRRGRPPKVRA